MLFILDFHGRDLVCFSLLGFDNLKPMPLSDIGRRTLLTLNRSDSAVYRHRKLLLSGLKKLVLFLMFLSLQNRLSLDSLRFLNLQCLPGFIRLYATLVSFWKFTTLDISALLAHLDAYCLHTLARYLALLQLAHCAPLQSHLLRFRPSGLVLAMTLAQIAKQLQLLRIAQHVIRAIHRQSRVAQLC